ncbi:MAG: chorismate-binding protein [Actinomycetota bacterium]
MVRARLDQFTPTDGRSMEFSDLARVVEADRVEDVIGAFEEAEAATREGLWAVGFVSYEAAPAFNPRYEALHRRPDEPLAGLPFLWFGLFRQRDSVPPFVGEQRLDASPYTVSPWAPTINEERYEANVERLRRLIRAGDLTQVNYALRLDAAMSGDLSEFYRDLVLSQRGGHGAHIDLGRFQILSASPEQFFSTLGSTITVRPMKGTIPRGRWSEEDRLKAEELATSEKDRGEHQVIVDRMGESLAAVAEAGSIKVEELMGLERLETVWQMSSRMTGELPDDATTVDVFRAMFPSSAVTGDPKCEAMEAIAAFEGRSRGVYGGAIGAMAPTSEGRPQARFSVAIRTLAVAVSEGVGEYGVGAGITARPLPRGEYDEALSKTRVLVLRRPEMRLLETLRWEEDHGFWWIDRHVERMEASASYFGFEFDEIAANRSLKKAVSDQEGARTVSLKVDRFGEIDVEVRPSEMSSVRWWPHPCRTLMTCEINDEPVASDSVYRFHSTTARRPYDDRRSTHRDVDEVLMVNERGEIVGAAAHNIAVRCGEAWVTPPLASGSLPGILRQVLIAEGVLTEEVIMVGDLDGAEGIALLSSVDGWRPARLVRR